MNGCPVLQHVIGDMDDKVITPIGKDRGARNSAVKGHACSKVTVRGALSLPDREPVLPGLSGVGPGGVVIGIETKLPPAFTGSRSVFTTLTRLQRCEMRVRLQRVKRKGDSRGGCKESPEGKKRLLHSV